MLSHTLRKHLALCAVSLTLVAVHARANDGTPDRGERNVDLKDFVQFDVQLIEIDERVLSSTDHNETDSKTIAESALKAVKNGTARIRYSWQTQTQVGSKLALTHGERVPFVRGRRTSKEGLVNSTIEYEDVGCQIELVTDWINSQMVDMVAATWRIEFSDLRLKSGVDINNELEAPYFINQSFSFNSASKLDEIVAVQTGATQPESDKGGTWVTIARFSSISHEPVDKKPAHDEEQLRP